MTEFSESRRKLLKALPFIPLALTSAGCEAQDPGRFEPKPVQIPAPRVETPIEKFNREMREKLVPGGKVKIWDGTIRIAPSVRRRYDAIIHPGQYVRSSDGTTYAAAPGPYYENIINSDEIVSPIDWGSGFAYFSPENGQLVWCGVTYDDTDSMIKFDGVLLKNLKDSTLKFGRPEVTVKDVSENSEDSLKRPSVTVIMPDGSERKILTSSKRLGF